MRLNPTKYPGICALCGAPFLGWHLGQRHCSRKCRKVAEMRPAVERFWEKVIKGPDCWLWTGAVTSAGYGAFNVIAIRTQKVTVQPHRYSWELANGPISDDLCVLHHCDTPLCVNPAHLFLGTRQDNMDDMIRKGRGGQPKGERNAWAKLTDGDVREIKRLLAEGVLSQRRIAERFGVNHGVVGRIKRGEGWCHVSLSVT